MKKLFALMMVGAFAVAIVACGGKKAEEATTTPAADSVPAATPADSIPADSIPADSIK